MADEGKPPERTDVRQLIAWAEKEGEERGIDHHANVWENGLEEARRRLAAYLAPFEELGAEREKFHTLLELFGGLDIRDRHALGYILSELDRARKNVAVLRGILYDVRTLPGDNYTEEVAQFKETAEAILTETADEIWPQEEVGAEETTPKKEMGK